MRVLVGPSFSRGQDAGGIEAAVGAARALAGPGGSVVSLPELGVRNLARPLSAAEVALLRQDLRRIDPGDDGLVGYVCQGRQIVSHCDGGPSSGEPSRPAVLAVSDHVNLTWRSPLTGPNDESAGPRFPSMTGVYVPDVAAGRLSGTEGMIVRAGVVAGVFDHNRLSPFEARIAREQGYTAASSELAPVVIVAAHMGLRVAAVVVFTR